MPEFFSILSLGNKFPDIIYQLNSNRRIAHIFKYQACYFITYINNHLVVLHKLCQLF
jgi:hypothetical protein